MYDSDDSELDDSRNFLVKSLEVVEVKKKTNQEQEAMPVTCSVS